MLAAGELADVSAVVLLWLHYKGRATEVGGGVYFAIMPPAEKRKPPPG